jgi:hypothetical protein
MNLGGNSRKSFQSNSKSHKGVSEMTATQKEKVGQEIQGHYNAQRADLEVGKTKPAKVGISNL